MILKSFRKSKIIELKNKKEKNNIKKTKRQKVKNKLKKEICKQKSNREVNKLKSKKPINFAKMNKKLMKVVEPIGNITRKNRIRWELIIAMMLLVCLITRIGYIQFVKGEELQSMAYIQQTLDRNINPKRGTIYEIGRAHV